MKPFKNFLVFLFIFLIPSFVFAENRDLSTPLSRLAGHWQAPDGTHYYFSKSEGSFGIFVRIFPKLTKEQIQQTIENINKAKTRGEITDVQEKEFLGQMDLFKGEPTYCTYRVISQTDKKIELEMLWNETPSDIRLYPKRVNFYIDEDGKQIKQASVVPYVGEIVNPMPLDYVELKTSPFDFPKSIFGTYRNENNPAEYLELKPDGAFFLRESGLSFWGRYEAKDDLITMKIEAGLAARARIVGNMIIDEKGKIWAKKVD